MLTPPFNLPAPGRRQCLYVVFTTSQTPVFLINSRLGRFSAACFSFLRVVGHLPQAPLLPKLRGHFAEFLDQDSLERLRLLASPTCVGFRYGRTPHSPAKLFSAVRLRSLDGGLRPPSASDLGFTRGICLPGNAYLLTSDSTTRRTFHLCVPPQAQTHDIRYGNLHPFPIGYASRPHLRGRLTLS